MSAPFPVLFTAPLGSPDWLGDAVVRVGNSLVHPRRQWVWEKSTKPVRTLAVRTHVGTQHVAPRAPTPAHSEHSTQPAFSILEHADQSEVLALPTLPRQASTATMTHSDPLLGSILNMRSRNADHQIISDDDLQNFLPPASSTPRTRTAGSRRGLSLASLSLRKRESLDPDMSKHAITASSRSFSSKSFFSARTFGPSSSDPQRSATDIDRE